MDISKLLANDNLGVDDIINSINGLFENDDSAYAEQSDNEDGNFVFDVDKLEQAGYSEPQISEIEKGINQGLPVGLYAKTNYNWVQMHEIRMGLLEGLDISQYTNSFFSGKQMRQIRIGLLQKLDVSKYAKLIMSTTDMHSVRQKLFEEAYNEVPQGHEMIIDDDNDECTIRISSDCMSAYIKLANSSNMSPYKIKNILKKYDITYGLIESAIISASEGMAGEEICIANGKIVQNGSDGWYEKFFDGDSSMGPRILADGRVDYSSIVIANRIETGEHIVQYHPATDGQDGMTVNGVRIHAIKGKNLPKLRGLGHRFDGKTQVYVATQSGCVQLDENTGVMNVCNIYTINGDVNRYNGRVKYDGTVLINGEVTDMAMIEASGDIIIEGFVGSAIIKAGRNVVLKRGMNAGGQGYVTSNGRVMGKFFESVTISSRDGIEGNYFLNCHLETEGKVVTRGSKARILGGEIVAACAVESAILGSNGATKLLINVGDSAWIMGKISPLKMNLDKVEDELRQLIEGHDKMESMLGREALQNPLYTRTCMAIELKINQKKVIMAEIDRLTEVEKKTHKAYINVREAIQQGVWVAINGVMREIQSVHQRVILNKEKLK